MEVFTPKLGKDVIPILTSPIFFKQGTATKLGHASQVQISGVGFQFLPILVIIKKGVWVELPMFMNLPFFRTIGKTL